MNSISLTTKPQSINDNKFRFISTVVERFVDKFLRISFMLGYDSRLSKLLKHFYGNIFHFYNRNKHKQSIGITICDIIKYTRAVIDLWSTAQLTVIKTFIHIKSQNIFHWGSNRFSRTCRGENSAARMFLECLVTVNHDSPLATNDTSEHFTT